MKATLYYRYTKTFSKEELFYSFWNKNAFSMGTSNPEKAFKNITLTAYNNTWTRKYLVHGHFCGTFNYLLKPANIPHSEKIDTDFLAYISIGIFFGHPFRHCSTIGPDNVFVEAMKNTENGIGDYKLMDDTVEVDDDEIITLLAKGVLPNLATVTKDKICDDGKSYDGEFTIKNLVAFDEPTISVVYKTDPLLYLSEKVCELSLPSDVPGKCATPFKGKYDSFFKRKKFPIVLEEFKKYFMDLLSNVQNGERSTV